MAACPRSKGMEEQCWKFSVLGDSAWLYGPGGAEFGRVNQEPCQHPGVIVGVSGVITEDRQSVPGILPAARSDWRRVPGTMPVARSNRVYQGQHQLPGVTVSVPM